MASTMLMAAVAQVRIANEDTQRCVAIRDFAILMTVISENLYLNGKQVSEPIQAEPLVAEAMFHQIVTEYGEMDGHPFRRLADWKYAGWFNGREVTLELVILK